MIQKIKLDEPYRNYNIYQIIDGAKNNFYNAHSPYLTSGLVTVTGDSLEEIKRNIDKIHERIKLIQLYHKTHHIR